MSTDATESTMARGVNGAERARGSVCPVCACVYSPSGRPCLCWNQTEELASEAGQLLGSGGGKGHEGGNT